MESYEAEPCFPRWYLFETLGCAFRHTDTWGSYILTEILNDLI